MKMKRKHTVPLSRQVIRLLNELKQYTGGGELLFPSPRANSAAITDAAPMAALRRMGYSKEMMTLHGFRAMASTRLNEMNFRPDTIEAQLSHKCADEVRLAYNRADYMAERKTSSRNGQTISTNFATLNNSGGFHDECYQYRNPNLRSR